jgi:hypothetical protein
VSAAARASARVTAGGLEVNALAGDAELPEHLSGDGHAGHTAFTVQGDCSTSASTSKPPATGTAPHSTTPHGHPRWWTELLAGPPPDPVFHDRERSRPRS